MEALLRSTVPRTFKGPWHLPATCDRAPQLEQMNAALLSGIQSNHKRKNFGYKFT